DIGLPHGAVTIAEALKTRGYATACFGKWHLGYKPPWLPPDQGFDEFRGLASGDGDYHTQVSRWGAEDWWRNNQVEPELGYTTDLLTRHSIDFIERHREKPFFLYLPHLTIHFPWQGPDDPPHRKAGKNYSRDKWGIIPNPANVAPHVKAMIETLDRSVGEIVAALKKQNPDRQTLVIFTSDNGGYLSYGKDFHKISSNGVLRGQKGGLHEGGHRVPMIASWPGKIRPGESAAVGHSTDFMPTLAAMAKADLTRLELDGVDLAPVLFSGQPLPEHILFWRAGKLRAVRQGPWKLYCIKDHHILYNLDDDIGEVHNLAPKHPDRLKAIVASLEKWEQDVDSSAFRSLGRKE
ncbi:MAG: arylsulfatase A, partial [Rhodothermales bacterium]